MKMQRKVRLFVIFLAVAVTPLRTTITESKPFEAQTTTLHGGTFIRIASEGASVGTCGLCQKMMPTAPLTAGKRKLWV